MQRRALLNWLAATAAMYALPTRAAAAPDHAALITRMRQGGHIILIRHAATVPGVGDPDGFVLTQCTSQRNLSDQGRADSVRIGEAFVRLGIPVGDVLSSRWCRCLDTARLAFGRVTPAPMLDSMFRESADGSARKQQQVAAWLRARHAAGNVVMVTHDVNIQALAGKVVRQGEMVLATSEQGVLRVEGVFTL